jgi:hypothetical protein
MPLYHFSENPNIKAFFPRAPLAHPEKEARVWAIDDWHSPLYFLPSDCPRATYWPVAATTYEDRKLHWPDDRVRMVIAIEHTWFQRFLEAKIYRYVMPEETFISCQDYGAHVSEHTITPMRVEEVGPLWEAMAEYSVDFRVMPSLRAFSHHLMETTFHWSFIRMRNAHDWDMPPGLPVMPK